MLSVILYGRNDSHGYNLHKRAAISLNCIAEVLDDASDEIIFVDYNTPNDMPTFVEAIQDTLTDKAKQRIRVLRVRPEVHRRFKDRTHLVALEPISRNVAVRRSNLKNRWILSTNTDMIFVPRLSDLQKSEPVSLSTIVAKLADGFYHLPRFELPEYLWESLDRLDPKGSITTIRDWGTRFHLNDVVYGSPTILYDAPGDFQLALRDDVFAIDGFNEEMILGWHVDSNFAKRMIFQRGAVQSALPSLFGYHCDHTRQSSLMHGRDRVENDQRRFVDEVTEPNLVRQKDTWGLAGEDVEEFRISNATSVYVRALGEVLPSASVPYSESFYNSKGWNDLNYDAEHVLPYLCDLLSANARSWNISYAGCRTYSFELLCKALQAMGWTGQILVPDTFNWLAPRSKTVKGIKIVPFDVWLKSGHVFIFEFGLGGADGPPSATGAARRNSDMKRLAETRAAFEALVMQEHETRPNGFSQARRVLAINVIHNSFEGLIDDNLSVTYTPFSSRIRHGYVIRESETESAHRSDPRTLAEWLRGQTQRSRPIPLSEIAELKRCLSEALKCVDDNAPFSRATLAVADQLLVLLEFPDSGALASDIAAKKDILVRRLRQERPSATFAAELKLPVRARAQASGVENSRSALSRMCQVEDWENPSWFDWVRRFLGGRSAYALHERPRGTWERASLLHGLDTFGMWSGDASLLAVVTGADDFVAALCQCARKVDLTEASALFSGAGENASALIPVEAVFDPDRLGTPAISALGTYDAVIFPHNAIMAKGITGLAWLLKRSANLLKDGGIIAFVTDICLNGRCEGAFDADLVGGDELAGALRSYTNLELLGPFEKSMSVTTLDRYSAEGSSDYSQDDLIVRKHEGLVSTSVWFLRKESGRGREDWLQFATTLLDRELHALMSNLKKMGLGTRSPDGFHVAAEEPSGFWVYGPYLRLLSGFYRVTADCRSTMPADPEAPVVLIDVVLGPDNRRAIKSVSARELAEGPVEIVFEVPPEWGAEAGGDYPFEIRFQHLGRASLHLADVRLTSVSAEEAEKLAEPAVKLDRSVLSELKRTELGRREDRGYAVEASAPSGFWLYGPYLPLPAGQYRASFVCRAEGAEAAEHPVLLVDIVLGAENPLAIREYRAGELVGEEQSILFEVPVELGMERGDYPFEMRFQHLGRADLHVTEVRLAHAAGCDSA